MVIKKAPHFLQYPLLFAIFTAQAGFVSDTLVKTADGYVPITQLAVGDVVVSWSEKDKNFHECPIARITSDEVSHVVRIQTSNAVIISDLEQKFYLPLAKCWCAARDLKPGHMLFGYEGELITITDLEQLEVAEKVYDLTIAYNHTFCVSELGIVSHNFAISFPILVFGGGEAALVLGAAIKAVIVGGLTAIAYDLVSKTTGASLDLDLDLSQVDIGRNQTPDNALICFEPPNQDDAKEQNEKKKEAAKNNGKPSEKPDNKEGKKDKPHNKPGNNNNGKGDKPKNEGRAPGKPTENDGFKPPKNWDGRKRPHPETGQYGWPDKKGSIWVPTGPKGHGSAHWDVEHPDGTYDNVYPGGKVRPGKR